MFPYQKKTCTYLAMKTKILYTKKILGHFDFYGLGRYNSHQLGVVLHSRNQPQHIKHHLYFILKIIIPLIWKKLKILQAKFSLTSKVLTRSLRGLSLSKGSLRLIVTSPIPRPFRSRRPLNRHTPAHLKQRSKFEEKKSPLTKQLELNFEFIFVIIWVHFTGF